MGKIRLDDKAGMIQYIAWYTVYTIGSRAKELYLTLLSVHEYKPVL